MSRPRVVTGADDRGRPIARWADPDPVPPGFGHMEPAFVATVERRRATPEELAAARAREAKPTHLTRGVAADGHLPTRPPTPPSQADAARMAISRQNGARRHVEVTAANRRALEAQRAIGFPIDRLEDHQEEPAVATTPDPEPGQTEPPQTTLQVLADAVRTAQDAWDELQAAERLQDQARVAWQGARAALGAAYRALDNPPPIDISDPLPVEPPPPPAPSERPPAPPKPPRDREVASQPTGGGPGRPLTTIQERVLDAAIRHRGNQRAVAGELGFKHYQQVTDTLKKIGAKGLLPIELIPLLPASFAKYSSV